MPLDPRVKRFLDTLAAGKPPNALDTSVAQRRLGLTELMKLAGPETAVGRIEDRILPGPAGPLGVRIYTPLLTGQSLSADLSLSAGPQLLPGLISVWLRNTHFPRRSTTPWRR